MSLINKMLQDIDARTGQPGAPSMPGDVRPVVVAEARAPWRRVALAGGVVVAVAAAGAFGWRMMERAPASVAAPALAAVPAAVAVPLAAPVPEMLAAAPVQVADVAPPVPAVPEPQPVAEPEPVPVPVPEPLPVKAAPVNAVAPKAAARVSNRVSDIAQAPAGRTETPTQQAENAYRRALLVLEDGRVTEAIATLQAGLRSDPLHAPSRQTLVGLLIEAKRPDDAMRQLQTALTLDARQPSMAMLLARLQIERGDDAIATLTRTLPYAAGNGDYHAFLAAALARAGRQHEAADHYGAALRSAPQNGVWWMGLGMALQAEKRDAEAVAAFEQARASGTLSGDLLGFVERRLRQLGR